MKKLFFLLLLVFILSTCEKDYSYNLNDPFFKIMDEEFLSALIKDGVDTNGDGLISYNEAESVTRLDVSGSGIKNMSGIEAFTSLVKLYCGFDIEGYNYFTELDLSKNVLLEELICWTCPINDLDISNNPNLSILFAGYCDLSDLDLSNCTNLTQLLLSKNKFDSLDISTNMNLCRIEIDNMPGLGKVCVWTTPFPPEGIYLDTGNSPNVYFTTDCNLKEI